MKKINLLIPIFPIIISTVTSLIYLYNSGGTEMDVTGTISLTVAIIGVAGALWAQVIQFKHDSKKIGEVKEDTIELKPKTEEIRENVKKVKDTLIETTVPTVQKIEERTEISSKNIQEIIEDLHYRQRLKQEMSLGAGRDYFVSGIENLYEENGRLSASVRQLTFERNSLIEENKRLNRIIQQQSQPKINHSESSPTEPIEPDL